MAIYPKLQAYDAGMELVDVFRGLNRDEKISEGEWSDELNLTADRYPMLAVRPSRSGVAQYNGRLCSLLAKEDLYALVVTEDQADLMKGTDEPESVCSFDYFPETQNVGQMISFGAYILIHGLNVWYNTADGTSGSTSPAASISAGNTITDAGVDHAYGLKLCPCDENGEPVIVQALMSKAQGDALEANSQQIEIDSGKAYAIGSERLIRQYSSTSGEKWKTVPNLLRIEATGIGAGFEIGDVVTLAGLPTEWTDGVFNDDIAHDDPDSGTMQGNWNRSGRFDDNPNGYREIVGKGTDYIVVKDVFFTRLITANATGAPSLSAAMDAPEMDFVIECQNRLWGCFYGEKDGKLVNEIYATELGSFTNWHKYDGTSMASYAASVGTDGPWTGAISYQGKPHFFKEKHVHKVYISATGAHQIVDNPLLGVAGGCGESLFVLDGLLYYMSRDGVCAYDGSTPVVISEALGHLSPERASFGGIEKKLYAHMYNAKGSELYTYDVSHGIWHMESDEDLQTIASFARLGDSLFACGAGHGTELFDMTGRHGQSGESYTYSCTSGLIGWQNVEQKYISRFDMRLTLPQYATMKVEIEYDSSGTWEEQGTITGSGTGSIMIPVRPRRCDHFRIRLTGYGEMRMYSFAKRLQKGSDAV